MKTEIIIAPQTTGFIHVFERTYMEGGNVDKAIACFDGNEWTWF